MALLLASCTPIPNNPTPAITITPAAKPPSLLAVKQLQEEATRQRDAREAAAAINRSVTLADRMGAVVPVELLGALEIAMEGKEV